jgi:hypothetical protein
MAGRRHRQKFGQPLDDAEDDGDKYQHPTIVLYLLKSGAERWSYL